MMSQTPTPAKKRGRKPASIGAYGTQDAIWRAIRELGKFTRDDLTHYINKEMAVNDMTVKSYLERLSNAGYLSVEKSEPEGARSIAHYTLERDTGLETPRLRKDGSKVTQGLGREQMWRTMKMLREFNRKELALAASTEQCRVSEASANEYLSMLNQAGYLIISRPSKPGTCARYRFLPSKYTGPRPPQIQRVKQLFDPNLNKVVWRRGEVE
jgi:predicted ArsR family transcriptional regulator